MSQAIIGLKAKVPVIVALPSLALPPVFSSPGARWSPYAVQLQAALLGFAEQLASAGVALVHPETLDAQSAPAARHDLRAELQTGFPYTSAHAEALAGLLATCVATRNPPKKGIITDLDDTVWRGIAGEVGPQGVSWNLENHSQIHGLYQQLLGSLAEQGVLLAIASKNDETLVRQIFDERKDDLLFPLESVFPLEVHWQAKSESVGRVLQAWNVGADSVIFIDDSPLELAEVKAAHPEVECILFPKNDYPAAAALLARLRDLLGKDTISEEDRLRMGSIRQASRFQQQATSGDRQEEFLAKLGAVITFTIEPPPEEPRTLELMNKTNQFNLNGLRYSEAEWRRLRAQPGAVVVSVAYRDQFGALGTIAVLAGALEGRDLRLQAWVMSCRAFSRRIEYRTLEFLFDRLDVDRIHFDFQSTTRNTPLRQSLAVLLGNEPVSAFTLHRDDFARLMPALAHAVEVRDGREVSVK
jgi:FkbH-like protein